MEGEPFRRAAQLAESLACAGQAQDERRTEVSASRNYRMWKPLLACAAIIVLASIPLHAQAPAAARADAGWQALQAGDGDRAAIVFREALIQNPRDPTLHFGAGVAAHLLGHEADAMESLRRALQLEPRLIGASALLGEIEHHDGEIDARSEER